MLPELEYWAPLPGYEAHYQISTWGRVFSNRSNRVMNYNYKVDGYTAVRVSLDGKAKTIKVHLYVARAFLPPQPFPEAVVRHKDDNRTNPHLGNLEWGTHGDNLRDKYARGRRARGNDDRHSDCQATS